MSATAPTVEPKPRLVGSRSDRPSHPPPMVLTSLPARPAHEVWTREQWCRLSYHLHNSNGDFDYILGWFGLNSKAGGRPEPIYRKSGRVPVSKAIPWAWSSLCGKGKKKVAVVFYAQNEQGRSRWAGVDFDAHSSDSEEAKEQAATAQRQAFALFRAVLNVPGCYVILEASGRGWHVWLLSKDFRPCDHWTGLLAAKLQECDIAVEDCELFPPADTIANRFGKGMRAPGCWSPARQEPSLILWENVSPILRETEHSLSLKDKKISLSLSLSLYVRLVPLLDEFVITRVGSRHNLLLKLTGHLFHQVGRDMAERFAVEQYARKKCRTDADKAGHLKEFGECWTGLHQEWLRSLTPTETVTFDKLVTDWERDAFRIIKSYARKAVTDGQADFMIVRDDLAARIGMTGAGAGLLVQRFCEAGILQRTAEYVPHKTAARYRVVTQEAAS